MTSTKRNGESTEYIVFDGEKYHRIVSKKRIRRKSVSFTATDIEELKESILEDVKRRFFRKARYPSSLPEEIAFSLPDLEKIWKELAFLKIINERPFVYFDPDADGMISLLLVNEALRVNFRALTPWNLEIGNSLNPDLRAPLFLLLDVGSTPELHRGVSFLSSIAPTYIVDHHHSPTPPPVDAFNPALKDPSLSRYCTSVLTSYLVKPWVERESWVRVGAAGDRSDVIEWNKEDRRRALALELSADVFGYNLQVWKQVVEGDLWKPLWDLLLHRFEKIDEIAEKNEVEVNGLRVLVVRYPHPGFYYPHRGKVASWYQDEGEYDVVIVEELPRDQLFTVSLRSSFDVFPLLEEVKERGLARGWGHPNAVTFKTKDPSTLVGFVLGWLEREDEEKGDGDKNTAEN